MASNPPRYAVPWSIKRVKTSLIFTLNCPLLERAGISRALPIYTDKDGKLYITQQAYHMYKEKYGYDTLWSGNPKGMGTEWPMRTARMFARMGIDTGEDATIENSVPVYIL